MGGLTLVSLSNYFTGLRMRDQRTIIAVPTKQALPASAVKPIRKIRKGAHQMPGYGEVHTSPMGTSGAVNPAKASVTPASNADRLARSRARNVQQFIRNREAAVAQSAYSLYFTLRDHTDAACRLVLLMLRDFGFRIMRQTKKGGVITAVVRYCADDIPAALAELAKILPIDPVVRVERFIMS